MLRIGLIVLSSLTLLHLVLWAQEPQSAVPFGDPPQPTQPTKAYNEAVRIKGITLKIGEVTPTSAVIWSRVPPRDETAFRTKREALNWLQSLFVEEDLQVRLRIGLRSDLSDAVWLGWRDADIEDDFSEQWLIEDLRPGTRYYFEIEGADETRQAIHPNARGSFRTAPAPGLAAPVSFTVVTGQRYDRLDHPEGFNIYPAMAGLNPDFAVLTGDTVYFDRGPLKAQTLVLARDRWRRLYELPRLIAFHSTIPAYWEKDDHDVLKDDASPYSKPFGEITFADGVRLFKTHTPVSAQPYRRFRWGKLVEIWLTEVREFRDDNQAPDGPEKSMLGQTQKAWLKRTLAASDAAWKILINPTPIVGPDRARYKNDNHANKAWQTEGDELRQWLTNNLGQDLVLVAGDRHWQYHSVDPATGLNEYGCGPASDAHAGGSPGYDDEYHVFHREAGGFLSVGAAMEAGRPTVTIRLHGVDGTVVHTDRRVGPIPRT